MDVQTEAYECMQYNSDIIVISSFDVLEATITVVLEEFERSGDSFLHIGFDLEWKPKVVHGSGDMSSLGSYDSNPPFENPVSLMQITINRQKKKSTYLIRMLEIFDRPQCGAAQFVDCALFRMLLNPYILKYGVGIAADVRKLSYDYFIVMRGAVELGELVRRVNMKAALGDSSQTRSTHRGPSLQGVVESICGIHIPKEKAVQCSNWEAEVLSEAQILYAASDSYHGLLTFEKIADMVQRRCDCSPGEDHEPLSLELLLRDLVDSGGTHVKNSSLSISGSTVDNSIAASARHSASAGNGEHILSAAQTPIYESCCIMNRHGVFLSYCDQDRVNWYLKKGLAAELDKPAVADCISRGVVDPLFASGVGRIIMLNFETNGPGNIHDSYRRQMLRNVCVLCGLVDNGRKGELQLLHHHVVPKAYRKIFPTCMVSKNNHDILPMCKRCKAHVALVYAGKMNVVERQFIDDGERDKFAAAMRDNNRTVSLRENYSKVKSLCRSLVRPAESYRKKVRVENADGTKTVTLIPTSTEKIAEVRQSLLLSLQSFCREINSALYSPMCGDEESAIPPFAIMTEVEVLDIADRSGVEDFLARFEALTIRARDLEERRVATLSADGPIAPKTMEALVIQEVIKPHQLSDDPNLYIPLLHKFEEMWRSFFLETFRPEHLPPHWRVDYKKIDPRHTAGNKRCV